MWGMVVDCTDITNESCGKHVRTYYLLYQYKLLYNGTFITAAIPFTFQFDS
jgi:hypothetical protein